MKKFLRDFLAVVLVTSLMFQSVTVTGRWGDSVIVSAAEVETVDVEYKGDVNGDGIINAKDVTQLRRFLAGGWNAEINEDEADLNEDGAVNAKDVTVLRRYLAGGWGVELPKKDTVAEFEVVEVSQAAVNQIKIHFDKTVTDVKDTDFRVYYIYEGEKFVEPCLIERVSGEDNIVYIVSSLYGGKEYFVEYKEQNVGSIIAETITPDSPFFPYSIEIPSGQVFDAGLPSQLEYKVLDKNGTDITKVDINKFNIYIMGTFFEIKTDDDESPWTSFLEFHDGSGRQRYGWGDTIQLFKEADYRVRVTLTYKGELNTEGGEKETVSRTLSSEGVITCKETQWELGECSGTLWKTMDINGKTSEQGFSIGDNLNEEGYSVSYFFITVPYSKRDTTVYEGFGISKRYVEIHDADVVGPQYYDEYMIESKDEDIVKIGEKVYLPDGTWCYKLLAKQPGKTEIVVKGKKNFFYYWTDAVEQVGTIPIEVQSERKPVSFTVEGGGSLNKAYEVDRITFNILLYDQYEVEMVGKPIKITQVGVDKDTSLLIKDKPFLEAVTEKGYMEAWTGKKGSCDFVLTPADILFPEGDGYLGEITLKFECEGFEYTTEPIQIGNDQSEKIREKLTVSRGLLDTSVKMWDSSESEKTIKVELVGVTKNGFSTNTSKSAVFSSLTPFEIRNALEHKELEIELPIVICNVYKDGKLVTEESMAKEWSNYKHSNLYSNFDGNVFKAFTTERLSVKGSELSSPVSNIITKLDSGSYRVAAYEICLAEDGYYKITALGNKTFTVVDTDNPIDVTKKIDGIKTTTEMLDQNIKKAYTVSFNGKKVDDSRLIFSYETGNDYDNSNNDNNSENNKVVHVYGVYAYIDVGEGENKGTLELYKRIDDKILLKE